MSGRTRMIVREDTAHQRLPTHPGPSILDEAKTMKGGFGTDTVLGQACSWDRSFKILGAGPLVTAYEDYDGFAGFEDYGH